MATLTIALPSSLRAFVETQMRRHGHASAAAYLESLIDRDRERDAKIDAMDARIAEGLDSGIGQRTKDEILAEGRRRARAREA